jgi:hypothetical protein
MRLLVMTMHMQAAKTNLSKLVNAALVEEGVIIANRGVPTVNFVVENYAEGARKLGVIDLPVTLTHASRRFLPSGTVNLNCVVTLPR